ncbi:D-alanyl-D-alanine carboxypeptidase/D-alanyl-D-alanine endopeptidase [Paracoccus tegillarcae]|uniref:D-alanyl-D-alanine carboxypeptidase/D-alanyl-D-alanine-endopeptidase n=1 Tax=Paracoccus tegillarcae TaxID=1529068 RepID=A0A2K9EIE7_9RHOB|nr:D-alanyl-D-alanine carboxypeptidase/D-alanyl-D-alanine-endopeptidase [Paracoccus tegillarcae]AUH34139.1 D-alanyl-D-alanine carboxypeptidase/D-alanyl-D-alanine-endopeptidase [Paracoccus tegillarcae]
MNGLNRRAFLTASAAILVAGTPGRAQEVLLGGPVRPPRRPAPSAKALVNRAGLGGSVAYAALDATTGQMIRSEQPDLPLPPASTLKAVTALYAMDRLGGDHRFRTRVMRVGDMLVLAGGGDPVLTTDDLARLADALVATGQQTPTRFAVWGGALPRIEELEPGQAVHLSYNPAISGMILNFNRVYLGWRQAGGDYQLTLEARADAHSPRAYTITARAAVQQALFTYSADERREHWLVSRASMGRAGSRWLPVRKPELYAGDVFQTLCRARGLVLPSPEVLADLPNAEEVAAVESPALRDILIGMMRYSTNLTAEVVGLHASGAASLAASGAAMRAWWQDAGGTGEVVFADHSGLSADSRVTAGGLARLMAGYGQKNGLRALMKDDPLVDTLGRTPEHSARIEAKTGTLNFVSNLAGYATGSQGGREIVFAVLCADLPRRARTEGQELPAGVSTWTKRAKTLQAELVETWVAPDPAPAVTTSGAEPVPITQ